MTDPGNGGNGATASTRDIDSNGVAPRALAETATSTQDYRMARVFQLEWALVWIRYFFYGGLIVLYVTGAIDIGQGSLLLLVSSAALHNGFAHFAFATKRQALFSSRLNFGLHLLRVSLIVGLTGVERSPLIMLYPLLIVGYCLWASYTGNTFRVALLCALSLSVVIGVAVVLSAHQPAMSHVCFQILGIVLLGWLMNILGEILSRTEAVAQEQSAALSASMATLRTILDSTAGPILVFDQNEFISDCNSRACEYLHVSRSQIIGSRFRRFLFDDGTLPAKFSTLQKRGQYQGEALVVNAEGDERNVDLLVRSFIRGGRRYFVAMMHDITERKNIQEAARQANLKLEQINRELQHVNQLRLEFSTTIAQQLRSPLSAILGYADMLLNEELGDINGEQRKALLTCRRSVLRAFGLVDESLDATGEPTEGGQLARSKAHRVSQDQE